MLNIDNVIYNINNNNPNTSYNGTYLHNMKLSSARSRSR